MKSGKQRNLNLTQRKLNTRDKIQPEVVKFSLDEIKKHFEDSISDIEEQFKTIDLLESKDREKIDYILRSQIVFFRWLARLLFSRNYSIRHNADV